MHFRKVNGIRMEWHETNLEGPIIWKRQPWWDPFLGIMMMNLVIITVTGMMKSPTTRKPDAAGEDINHSHERMGTWNDASCGTMAK